MSEEEPGSRRTRAKIAREVRQRLETNRLFGWSVPLSRSRIRPGRGKARGGGTGAGAGTGAGTGTGRGTGRGGDRERKEALLRPIREEVSTCTRCALGHSRTQAVFGVGDPETRILFIGEAPGFDEDRQGEPFVGRAGQLLNDIIKAMGLRREQVYIANVIKCRPPQNRVPNPAEVGSCIGYLERQIEIIAPEVIVALGSVAAKAVLGTEQPIGRLRNRFHDYRGIPVMPTYHPAYLLRNPAEKRKVWEDIQLVMARLGLGK